MSESDQQDENGRQTGSPDGHPLLIVSAFGVLATMGAVILIINLAGRSPITIDATESTVFDGVATDIDVGIDVDDLADRAADAAVDAAVDAAKDQVTDRITDQIQDRAVDAAGDIIDQTVDGLATTTSLSTDQTTTASTTAVTTTLTTAVTTAPDTSEVVTIGLLPSGSTLVRLVDPGDESASGDGQDGCETVGSLALKNKVGTVFHRYDNSFGPLDFQEGPYGQVALIERCAGQVSRVMLMATAGLSAEAVPSLVVWERPQNVAEVSDPGWLGLTGHFSLEATLFEEDDNGAAAIWTETLVIDASDGSTDAWADVFGQRQAHPLVGLDVIVPNGWTATGIDDEHTTIVLRDSTSDSSVSIDVAASAQPPPSASGDETPAGVATTTAAIWDQLDDKRALRIGTTDATDHRFTGSGGERLVRTMMPDGPDGPRIITIDAFTARGANLAAGDIPMLVVESVRVYNAVG